jgi:hypothetical protein
MDDRLISDQELISRLRRSAQDSRQHCEQAWKLIHDTHVLLHRLAVMASPAITKPKRGPGRRRSG